MLMLRKRIQKSYGLENAIKNLSKSLALNIFYNRKGEAVTGKDLKKNF